VARITFLGEGILNERCADAVYQLRSFHFLNSIENFLTDISLGHA
jgi:hypothetical protein